MNEKTKFDAVFVDIDDTILDFTKCSRSAVKNCFLDFNYDIDEPAFSTFFDLFMTLNLNMWQQVERGLMEKSQLHNTRFNIAFERFNIVGLDGIEFEKRYRVHLATTTEKVDGADEFLTYLSARYPLFVASNAPYNQQIVRLTKENLIQHFADIYTSELVGSEKPKKDFFDECFARASEKLGFTLLQKNTAIIGDSLSADIGGGKNYGMTTIWFNIYKTELFAGYKPDFTINSLDEITKIL